MGGGEWRDLQICFPLNTFIQCYTLHHLSLKRQVRGQPHQRMLIQRDLLVQLLLHAANEDLPIVFFYYLKKERKKRGSLFSCTKFDITKDNVTEKKSHCTYCDLCKRFFHQCEFFLPILAIMKNIFQLYQEQVFSVWEEKWFWLYG